ncbi:unnamed protein product, partial [Polarella glacialis]
DTAVDLWALGSLVYELLIGHGPFWGSVEELRKKVLAVDLRYPPGLLSTEAIQLFYCLLQKDPRSRVPCHQLLRDHPWVRRALEWLASTQPVGSSGPHPANGLSVESPSSSPAAAAEAKVASSEASPE